MTEQEPQQEKESSKELSTQPSKAAGQLAAVPTKHDHDLSDVGFQALLIELRKRLQGGETPCTSGATVSVADYVWESLGDLLDVHENRFSKRRFQDIFGTFYRRLDEPRPVIRGTNFLDLGCGSINPLGTAMLMCTLGARSAHGLDFELPQDVGRAARGLARIADAMLQNPAQIVVDYEITREEVERNLHGFNLEQLRAGIPAGLGSRMKFHPVSAADMPFEDESIGLVNSNSFLEHVEDLDGVLDELARVTSSGAFCIHGIDGADHQHYVDSSIHRLQFLHEPGPGMYRNSNRIRPLEFAPIFEKHGFQVQQFIPMRKIELTGEQIAAFAEPWCSMTRDVLEVVSATVVTRRV